MSVALQLLARRWVAITMQTKNGRLDVSQIVVGLKHLPEMRWAKGCHGEGSMGKVHEFREIAELRTVFGTEQLLQLLTIQCWDGSASSFFWMRKPRERPQHHIQVSETGMNKSQTSWDKTLGLHPSSWCFKSSIFQRPCRTGGFHHNLPSFRCKGLPPPVLCTSSRLMLPRFTTGDLCTFSGRAESRTPS